MAAASNPFSEQHLGWFARALLWLVESLAAGLMLWLVLAAVAGSLGVERTVPPAAAISLVSPFLLFYNVDRLVAARTAD